MLGTAARRRNCIPKPGGRRTRALSGPSARNPFGIATRDVALVQMMPVAEEGKESQSEFGGRTGTVRWLNRWRLMQATGPSGYPMKRCMKGRGSACS